MNLLTQALGILNRIQDEEILPTGAKLIIAVEEPEADTQIVYVSWTGTQYPTRESAPWQCRESLVEVKV